MRNMAAKGSILLNGGSPVNISIRVIPKAQTSFARPAAAPLITLSSGIYKYQFFKDISSSRTNSDGTYRVKT